MLRPGTLPCNVLIGPGVTGWNPSFGKNFEFTEQQKPELRAETFNMANHPLQFALKLK
jgi:hypothetical protein